MNKTATSNMKLAFGSIILGAASLGIVAFFNTLYGTLFYINYSLAKLLDATHVYIYMLVLYVTLFVIFKIKKNHTNARFFFYTLIAFVGISAVWFIIALATCSECF
jgi:hypothetical protein